MQDYSCTWRENNGPTEVATEDGVECDIERVTNPVPSDGVQAFVRKDCLGDDVGMSSDTREIKLGKEDNRVS